VKVEILDEAERDLTDGFRFYEAQAEGLGDYFLDSLSADIDSLRLYAGIHPLHAGQRRLLSKRFPFAIYYDVDGHVARVNAVLDCRRDPAWIQDRLK
jgi:plasmid stabilization system protein ParE